jgi:hypothetical protein
MKKALLFLCVVAFFSCGEPIPRVTIDYQPDLDGYIQFSTNDSAYCNSFRTHLEASTSAVFTNLEVTCKKISGFKDFTYGVVFCAKDLNNYYVVLISTIGTYRVNKMKNGVMTTTIPATGTAFLTQGYNQNNKVGITRSPAGLFTISFNNSPGNNFTDTDFADGMQYGFLTSIGRTQDEKFPSIPVDVRFRVDAVAP